MARARSSWPDDGEGRGATPVCDRRHVALRVSTAGVLRNFDRAARGGGNEPVREDEDVRTLFAELPTEVGRRRAV